jgi:hypothetical protein
MTVKMHNVLKLTGLAAIGCLFTLSCQNNDAHQDIHESVHMLPMNSLDLSSLDAFRSPGSNWSIAGEVVSDYQTDGSIEAREGTGVLVNRPAQDLGDPLITEMEHGDIELRMEFLVPKGSNSGIYFQGRYEVQILDSWLKESPTYQDNGGIYERWDDSQPEGQQGYEGHPPRVNASMAPGLWQDYHILFRAPRFDGDGNKIRNARFEYIYLNGTLIHHDVEVTGPTRGPGFEGEAAEGPLLIQGDHGPLAIRSIEYKKYDQADSLTIDNLAYTVYDHEGVVMPDFSTLEVLEEGMTDSFNVRKLSPKQDHFAMRFTGELNVPVGGDYLFETHMDKSGDLSINDELVVFNSEDLEPRRRGNIINLEEGTHKLEIEYFQVMWGGNATVYYEGPNMEKRTLASDHPWESGLDWSPLVLEPQPDEPEITGGFARYRGETRTQLRHVGHPSGIHYSYDLEHGELLRFWRGPFADVSEMWEGRGQSQLLQPLNAILEAGNGIPVVNLSTGAGLDNGEIPEGFRGGTSYELVNGLPVFTSYFNDIEITDHIFPADDNPYLRRSIEVTAPETKQNMAVRLAQGEQIELLDNGLYRVDGSYYIKPDESIAGNAEIQQAGNQQLLYVPVLHDNSSSSVEFELIW